ncbi:MAG: FAD-binding protein, partial [Anaerolineae bacterium]
MPYPPQMQESVEKVEASRNRRLSETHPRLTSSQKQGLLKRFHPDYMEGGMRALAVGPNKGDFVPRELADLLEGRSHLDPTAFELWEPDHDVDVLVIGGGGGGAAAALTAQENGATVLLVTKLRLGDANTMMAQGGIQAADKPNDSPAIHYLDVIGGGGFTNIPALVEALVTDAPSVIQWLEDLGCMFDKEPDGTMLTIHLGGTSRKRVHTAKDYTGMEIMRTLRAEVRTRPIQVLEFSPAIELLEDERGQCAGVVLCNIETGEYSIVRAKAVILATGGCGRLHIQGFPTTNHYGATADGLVLAYRIGAKLIFLDTMQYHPTGAAFPEQIVGQLVTEKMRGLGAQLVNIDGDQFIYPLETRDAVTSAIIRECNERGKGIRTSTGGSGVWLDSPMIEICQGQGTIVKKLAAMYRQYGRFGIDIREKPVLVYPTFHYQNGGILIGPTGETGVPHLFSVGEVSGGVHGRNRLGG